eukprot:CAMPEP_0182544264 /NCGR_PEP_ID=MMETSP1323-20130603/32868_1 /TAXON_ID=236787 /ORGANISM="Florenciella parvula, Strain RCC1693" /LENGTH=106 /DNA_ID=CAMNT_0024755277 /DNA_START=148 /DNA_END=466 /DNA_ORIENTATION=-
MGSKMSSARRTSEGTFKGVPTNTDQHQPDSPNSLDSPAKGELLEGSRNNIGGGRRAHEFDDGLGDDDGSALNSSDATAANLAVVVVPHHRVPRRAAPRRSPDRIAP